MAKIRSVPLLTKHLRSLKEVDIEYLTVDSRTVITDHPTALVNLMGDHADAEVQGSGELDSIANRLMCLLSTLGEFPSIRCAPWTSNQLS